MRLSVFRSGKHIYAQLIDDSKGVTLAAASSLDKDVKGKQIDLDHGSGQRSGRGDRQAAREAKVKEVVFDRGGYLFHGRVKALADAAREDGLSF